MPNPTTLPAPVAGGTYTGAGGVFDTIAVAQLQNAMQLGSVGNGTSALTLGGNLTLLTPGLVVESFTDGITAGTTQTQNGATGLTSEVNRIATNATPGNGVRLMAAQQGLTIFVLNDTANSMQVWPNGTDSIDAAAASSSVNQMAFSLVLYTCATAGKWRSEGLSTGFDAVLGLQTLSYADAVSAVTPVAQSTATAIVTLVTRVATVSASGAAVALPTANPGLMLQIINATANPLTVFPINGGTDAINGLAANASVIVPGNSTAFFLSTATTVWNMTVSTPTQGPLAAGATLTLTAASSGTTVLLNQATGSVVTLPAATGSGNIYKFVVSVAAGSNKHAVLAASSSDNLMGLAIGQNANTAKVFQGTTASGFHSLQMPFAGTQPSGGLQGDNIVMTDVAANTWDVLMFYSAGTTPTTPFSTATS